MHVLGVILLDPASRNGTLPAPGGDNTDAGFLLLSLADDSARIVEAIAASTGSYMLAASDVEHVTAVIEKVLRDRAPIGPATASELFLDARAAGSDDSPVELTARELDVLEELVKGRSLKEIAFLREISRHTVGDHVKSIYRKLDVNSRGQAINKALRLGLVRIEEPSLS